MPRSRVKQINGIWDISKSARQKGKCRTSSGSRDDNAAIRRECPLTETSLANHFAGFRGPPPSNAVDEAHHTQELSSCASLENEILPLARLVSLTDSIDHAPIGLFICSRSLPS